MRGLTYLRGNDRAGAKADFAMAARLDPSYADAYIGLGSLSLMDGDYAAAREGFERALSLDPRNVHARFNLGVALESTGDAAGAMAQFERACDGGHPRLSQDHRSLKSARITRLVNNHGAAP